MKKALFTVFLILMLEKISAQIVGFDNPYKALLNHIYFDPAVQIKGSLLGEPGEIKKNKHPDIIHLVIRIRENVETKKLIEKIYKTRVVFSAIDEGQEEAYNFLIKEKIIDTSAKIYSDSNFNVLGSYYIVGVYKPNTKFKKERDSNENPTLFFEVVRLGYLSSKSQLGQVIKVVKNNNKWEVYKEIETWRS